MVGCAEVRTRMLSNDCQLMVGRARSRVDGSSKIIVTNCWAPIGRLAPELDFTVAREIAEADKGAMRRQSDRMTLNAIC